MQEVVHPLQLPSVCVWGGGGGADEIHVLWWKSSWWVSTFRFVCTHCILSTGLKSNNDQVWGGGGGGCEGGGGMKGIVVGENQLFGVWWEIKTQSSTVDSGRK